MTERASPFPLVMEQPQAAEGHGDAVLVAGVDDLLVADGAAGLHDGGHAGAAGALDVVTEGEESVRTKAHTGHLAEVSLLFLGGQRLGLAGEGLGPDIITDDVLRGIADVNINGVVAVGLCHIVAEGQVQHLVHVAQLPVICLLTGQTGAVDAALLACTHADGLAIVGVAHAVGSQFANHIVNVMHNTTEIVDDLLTVKGPFLKIAFANMTSRRTTDCLKELQEKFSSEIKVVTSGNIWIDFIVPGCNKGSALRNLMDLFGITPEECVAFGDQYNDVEMLETVGMGYAMSNAAPGIAGHAKYITDSVEEVLEDILAGLDL